MNEGMPRCSLSCSSLAYFSCSLAAGVRFGSACSGGRRAHETRCGRFGEVVRARLVELCPLLHIAKLISGHCITRDMLAGLRSPSRVSRRPEEGQSGEVAASKCIIIEPSLQLLPLCGQPLRTRRLPALVHEASHPQGCKACLQGRGNEHGHVGELV